MNCLEFRRMLAATPQSRDPRFIAHRDSCPACATAWDHAQHSERRLHEALAVDVPERLVERVLLAQATGTRQKRRRQRRFGLAVAASLLLAVVAGGLFWRHIDAQKLPALAVAHMPPEMAALKLTRPVADAMIVADFADRGLSLPGPIPAHTTYVHKCMVGPYRAVHLVTRADGEPVVVLYLPHKQLRHERRFLRGGWHGLEMPLTHGSVVVMTDRGNARPLAGVAQAWRQAIEGPPAHRLAML